MARLTRAQRASLEAVLSDLDRAAGYLDDARTTICRRDRVASDGLCFTRPPLAHPEAVLSRSQIALGDYCLREVDKHIGSHIAGFWSARHDLRQMLEAE
jgi:hypothetical protein